MQSVAINFSQIRGVPGGQNQCFEELATQLFIKSSCINEEASFFSVRGAGGDGGVEAYFLTKSEKVIGLQAKYFFKLGDSQLSQIKESFETALKNHPTLSEYWIYIPFDLTGKVASGTRGKSEIEKFETWKNQKITELGSQGKQIEIKLCSASIIQEQLFTSDHYGGMIKYWFGVNVLTIGIVNKLLAEAKSYVGVRYSDSLDLTTSAVRLLDFFGGTYDIEDWYDSFIAKSISSVREKIRGNDYCETFQILPEEASLQANLLLKNLLEYCVQIKQACHSNIIHLIHNILELLNSLLPLTQQAKNIHEQNFYDNHGIENDTIGFRQFHSEYMCAFPADKMDTARELDAILNNLRKVIAESGIKALSAQSLLLLGPAGIGKTHSIISATQKRLQNGAFSIVLFAEDFGNSEPWEVIRSKLGFGANVGKDELFECLATCAWHSGYPFIIFIDALNENPRNIKWKHKLPELFEQCKEYSQIKFCVSLRDSYKNMLPTDIVEMAFIHEGFGERIYEAIVDFTNYYNIQHIITPLLSSEFANPLFLHLVCKTISAKNGNDFDLAHTSFNKVFDEYLLLCNEKIKTTMGIYKPQNLVRMALQELVAHYPKELEWNFCTKILIKKLGNSFSIDTFLNELQNEQLILISEKRTDEYVIRIAYERYSDLLRAANLLDSCYCSLSQQLDIQNLKSKLISLAEVETGLMEMLAILLPELYKCEIVDGFLENKELAYSFFIKSLLWRSRTSVHAETAKYIYYALDNIPWLTIFETLFQLSVVPNHSLNLQNFLHSFLLKCDIVSRDGYFAHAVFVSYRDKKSIYTIIHSVFQANFSSWSPELITLFGGMLTWLTASPDRRIRDLSSKALVFVLREKPELALSLLTNFHRCGDEYIIERLILAIYSACLLEYKTRQDFVCILEKIFELKIDSPNVQIRGAIVLLSQLLESYDSAKNLSVVQETFPEKALLPKSWDRKSEVDAFLKIEKLPKSMDLTSLEWTSDFWKYKVAPRIDAFDLAQVGIKNIDIANWIMAETYKLGYPGVNSIAIHYDKRIMQEFGGGRAKEKYAERLGKKYYWIQLYRLLGIFSDNILYKPSSYGWRPKSFYMHSIDLRNVDLTDVRDITVLHNYPNELLKAFLTDFPQEQGSMQVYKWIEDVESFDPQQKVIYKDRNNIEWVLLSCSYTHSSSVDRASYNEPYFLRMMHYQSFFVSKTFHINKLSSCDTLDLQEPNLYHSFIAEYPCGSIYQQLIEVDGVSFEKNGYELSTGTLARGGEWEYDFSYIQENRQAHFEVPCPSIVQSLELHWDESFGWNNADNELIVFMATYDNVQGVFIKREALNKYLDLNKKKCYLRFFKQRCFCDLMKDINIQGEKTTYLKYNSIKNANVAHKGTSQYFPDHCKIG